RLGSQYGVAEAAVGAIDLVSEGREHVCEHHRYERLVLDKQYAFVVDIKIGCDRRLDLRLGCTLRGVSIGFVRHEQGAAQAICLPVKFYETAKRTLDARNNGAAPIAAALGWGDPRAAGFRPDKFELSG